jgi:hypothetical protein
LKQGGWFLTLKMDEQKFDELMCMVAKECGSIHSLLDMMFGFFRRRTDFYVHARHGEQMGFLPGVA